MANIEKRVTKDGIVKYRVKIRLRQGQVQSATFDSKSKAKEWAQMIEAEIRAGRYFKIAEAQKHTFADLVDRYIREVLPRQPKSEKKQAMQLKWWMTQLGHYTLANLTPAVIVDCRSKLEQEITVRGKKLRRQQLCVI